MTKRYLPFLLTLLLLGVSRSFAAETAATVTIAVNIVTHGPAQTTTAYPAKAGTVVQDGEYVKTGAASRAEMLLANKTVTRLGANTIFNYSAATNTVDLQAGTFLFSKPKDARPMTIKTAAVTASIVGTTGFVYENSTGGFMLGLVEGETTLTINGQSYTISAGQFLQYTPGSSPVIASFDVQTFCNTSTFFTGYTSPLPNQSYIDQELAEYKDLVGRGFIQPSSDPFTIYDNSGNIPGTPVIGNDSAGSALNDSHMQPMPQPTPQPTPNPSPPPP